MVVLSKSSHLPELSSSLNRRSTVSSIYSLYYQAMGNAFLKFKVAAKAGNVTLWWRAELLLVIAVKVRRVLVADAESGARRVQVFAEHQTACFLESYLFLKLQGTHRCHGLEVMVKAGDAHPKFVRDLFHLQLFVKMLSQVADRFRNAAGVASSEQMCKPRTLTAGQQSVNYLLYDERCEEFALSRRFGDAYQSRNSVKQVGVYRADVHRLNAGVTLFYPYAGFNNDRSDQGGI